MNLYGSCLQYGGVNAPSLIAQFCFYDKMLFEMQFINDLVLRLGSESVVLACSVRLLVG